MRSVDKSNEARYFVEKLKETGGKGAESRFLLSALASASRSMTLILQADLRSKSGSEFDVWWQPAKERISHHNLPFEEIRHIRNVSQKEGNGLPLYYLEAGYDDHPIDNVQVLFDPSSKSKPMNELFINLKGDPKPIPAEAREELSPSELDELIGRRALEEIKQVLSRLNEPNVSLELKGYLRTEEVERYDVEEIVDGFRSTLLDWRT